MTGRHSKQPRPLGWGFLLLPLIAPVTLATWGQGAGGQSPVLGAPLSIDGKVVPAERIKREVCLGRMRARWLSIAMLEVVAETERRRRIQADETSASLEKGRSYLGEPAFDFDVDELASWEGVGFVADLRSLFLPEDPADYPPATLELESDPRGMRMLQQMRMIHDSAAPDEELSYGERQLQLALLQAVVRRRLEQVVVVEAAESLPAGVLLRIDTTDVSLERVWAYIALRVAQADVATAKKWLVNLMVLERALRKEGVWLSDAAARSLEERIVKRAESRAALLTTIEGWGFPSLEAYFSYREVSSAFHRLRGAATEEALTKHHRERLSWIEGSTVDVDILLLSAYDFETSRWRPGGWQDAEVRTREALRVLTEEGRPWIELLLERSEFPPSRGLGRRKQRRPKALRGDYPGALRTHSYGDLQKALGEDQYTRFVNGGSVTDLIFFELPEGELGPAVVGAWGWMVPLLQHRTLPAKRLIRSEVRSVQNEGTFMAHELLRFLGRRVAESDIRGL